MVTIVEAFPEDAEAIVVFLGHIGKESEFVCIGDDGFHLTAEEEREMIVKAQKEKLDLIILAKDSSTGEILGSATAFSNRRRSSHVFTLGVSVRRSHWRQGVGGALFAALIEGARKRGAQKLSLVVCAPNEVAMDMYERKFGFVREGVLRRQFKTRKGEYVDEVVMSYFYDDVI